MNDTITTENRVSKTPFSRWNKINRAIHVFNDAQKIKRNGKELNLQQYINENNIDCTIYQVLETYRGDLKITREKMNTLTHEVAQQLSGVNGLNDALQIMEKAKDAWVTLPLTIRKEFNNNIGEFQKNGLSWANQKIAELNKLKQQQNTNTGENNE